MRPWLPALAFVGLVGLPAAAVAASPERQQEALEAIAAVLAGKQSPETIHPYFAAKAVLVGPGRQPWDLAKFRAALEAGSCGTRANFWPEDRVLGGVNNENAAELRQQGHPKGPGLTFYCAGPKVRAGHSMITFKFKGDKIIEVEQAYYVHVPPAPPPPPGFVESLRRGRAAGDLVKKHFIIMARSDPAELRTLFEEVAAVPVAGAVGVTNLRDYYLSAIAQEGRMVTSKCFAAQDFDSSREVRCRLSVEHGGAEGAVARSSYLLTYFLKNDRVERMAVSETSPSAASE